MILESPIRYKGFVKVWQTHLKTGACKLLVDQWNTAMYQGADLLAYALAGQANAKISHLYVGYLNSADNPPTTSKPVAKTDTKAQFAAYADPYGYLRLPLTFPVSFASTTNYEHNIPVFTTMITSSAATQGGATFTSSAPTPSWIFEVASAAALVPSSDSNDVLYARAQFSPIKFDAGYSLTISWGVRFTVN